MRRAGPLCALLALAALAGCGDGDEPAPRAVSATTPAVVDVDPGDAKAVGTSRAGSVATFADCADWKAATRAERFATIVDIRGQFTPQGSSSNASPLPDEHAYRTFQEACEPEWADSLRLYKLYVKVQGFAPLTEG